MTIDYETTVEGIADQFNIDVPIWMDGDISLGDIEAICYGGCASGAYMPAVTYRDACATMAEHGDDVLEYIQENIGELPKPSDDESWSGMACFYLSYAVELWAMSVAQTLADADEVCADIFGRVV